MSNGSNFEDELIAQLSELLGDDGVVMRQKQELRRRAGKFQAEQYVDILIDSPDREYYIGIEAKYAKADSNTPKFYLSAKYQPEQIEKQVTFAEQTGRRIFVAVYVENHEGEDYELLFPLSYFEEVLNSDESGIRWQQLVDDGYSFDGGLTLEDFEAAEDVSPEAVLADA